LATGAWGLGFDFDAGFLAAPVVTGASAGVFIGVSTGEILFFDMFLTSNTVTGSVLTASYG